MGPHGSLSLQGWHMVLIAMATKFETKWAINWLM